MLLMTFLVFGSEASFWKPWGLILLALGPLFGGLDLILEALGLILEALGHHFRGLGPHLGGLGASFLRLGGVCGPSWLSKTISKGLRS